MFNVHIQGKLLLTHACHVQVLVPLSGTGKKKGVCVGGGGGGGGLHWRVQGTTSSPTGIGSRRRVIMI